MVKEYISKLVQGEDLSFKEAFLIGTVQGLAFQPGVSRAGAALTITRWLHLERVEAARFVFLMSLPVIAGAGLLKVGDLTVPSGWWPPFLVGTVAASVSGYLAVHWLLRFVSQGGFGIFMGYRLAIGISIFIILLTDWR